MTESKYTNSLIPESLALYLNEKCGRSRKCKADMIREIFEKVEINLDELVKTECEEKLKQAYYVPADIKITMYTIQQEVYRKFSKRIHQKVIFYYILKKFLEGGSNGSSDKIT